MSDPSGVEESSGVKVGSGTSPVYDYQRRFRSSGVDAEVLRDLYLLETGLDALGEAAVSGRVTVVVVDEVDGVLTGDLPSLIVKLKDALRRVRDSLAKS